MISKHAYGKVHYEESICWMNFAAQFCGSSSDKMCDMVNSNMFYHIFEPDEWIDAMELAGTPE